MQNYLSCRSICSQQNQISLVHLLVKKTKFVGMRFAYWWHMSLIVVKIINDKFNIFCLCQIDITQLVHFDCQNIIWKVTIEIRQILRFFSKMFNLIAQLIEGLITNFIKNKWRDCWWCFWAYFRELERWHIAQVFHQGVP